MAENEAPTPADAAKAADAGKGTFTQQDVDRIIGERLARQEADLTAKATAESEAKAKSLADRIQSLESDLSTTKANALRSSVAARFGVSTKPGEKGEPSDADLFLTGSDEKTLVAQAQRLTGLSAERRAHGNVAPTEGGTKTKGKGDAELREFARDLFGNAN